MDLLSNILPLSVCMIVKNEEKMLPECLESVKSYASEIIVVDTGSVDNTIQIAEKYNCKIIKSKWQNDFSFSRNIALENASQPYILSIDADERLVNPEILPQIIKKSPENTGGWLVQVISGAKHDDAGTDEAKYELQEIIEFLKDPQRFQKLGGKIPKGVLLLGPPGTGKTLLARAVAGEADVPFFSISGADFVEMFVGVGASRVRDLFEQSKKNAPCIVFIDEIDAVGRHRGAGLGGGHDEREQTLNQLLVEMDGFEQNSNVIIIAATNRPDVLDPALLRPGRFDRQVVVDLPDIKGREGIFKVHTKKIPLSDDVDVNILARGTPGFSGADIANLVNEAALFAARRNSDKVTMYDIENAKDKVMMGIERKSMVISDKEKEMTAYHEMGHALVTKLILNGDPVHKVTIIPRGRALGVTSFLPLEDAHSFSKDYIETRIIGLLAGRAAERIVFNQVTTGAANDLEKATNFAKKMVCDWGMSDTVGPVKYANQQEEVFLGREITQPRDHSELTAQLIDTEIRKILLEASNKAEEILKDNIDLLHRLSKILKEREVLDGEELDMLIRGEELPPLTKNEINALKSMKFNNETEMISNN